MTHKCRVCGQVHHRGDPRPLECWPWRDIITLERRWLEKAYRKPRCELCDLPLLCGQAGSHVACQRLVSVFRT